MSAVLVTAAYDVPGEFGYDPVLDALITTTAKEHGLEWDGSGSGFGQRDHTLLAPTHTRAELFADALKELAPQVLVQIHRGDR